MNGTIDIALKALSLLRQARFPSFACRKSRAIAQEAGGCRPSPAFSAILPLAFLLLAGGFSWIVWRGLPLELPSFTGPSAIRVEPVEVPQSSGLAPAPRQIAATRPANGSAPAVQKPNYLSTAGSKLVDAQGREVRLTGVNWFGLETNTFSPHGLWARNWQDMLDQIVAAGYNTIRLPYSSQALDPNAKPLEGIDYRLNHDLRGLTGLQIMDKIVAGAGERGLKIILDHHRPNTEAQSKLWYTDFLPEEQWIADWQTLAKRYLGNDTGRGRSAQ